jgi:hypothetical protein
MQIPRWVLAGSAFALLLATCGEARGQALPLEPDHNAGASLSGAFEGWFPDPDGTYSILVGYFNRNLKEPLDIPIGPNNDIEPGGPDHGQPTHFLPGRGWGLFTINVPKDFGNKSFTWTLVVNGVTTSIPVNLAPLWRIAPFIDATGDTPAYIAFSEDGPFVNGPVGQSESITATAGTPLPLTVWVADDAKSPPLPSTPVAGGVGRSEPRERQPVTVRWAVFRGPREGAAQFTEERPKVEKLAQLKSAPPETPFYGKAMTTATFNVPGQYVLSIQAFDATGEGGGGFQCCWSNAKVNVSVSIPRASGNE